MNFQHKYYLLRLVLLFLFLKLSLSGNAQLAIAEVVVSAGSHLRINCPVSVVLTDTSLVKTDQFIIKKFNSSKESYCQLESGAFTRLWWIIEDTLRPGEERTYVLIANSSEKKRVVATEKNNSTVKIRIGDSYVLQYNYIAVSPPQGIDSVYTRSGFIHPLWTPSGDVLTRIQPPDHYHHYGIWNPWTKTRFEDQEVDFWNLNKTQGTVRHKNFGSLTTGSVYGGFTAQLDHLVLSSAGCEKTALNEEWDVRVWNTGNSDEKIYLWDFTSTLNCASSSPLILEKYRYGGFGFRANEIWTNKNSYVLTSEGISRKNADGTRGKWCNVYGEINNGLSGILFMSHSENRDFPEPMRIWPENANGGRGDVFFNFCPVKQKDWHLEPGNKYILKYRMLVYDGEISPETAERLWQDFVYPPEVKIKLLKTK